mgnify:CR=1 FL=1
MNRFVRNTLIVLLALCCLALAGCSGNVGVGTDYPNAKLDVQGTVIVGSAGDDYDVNFYATNSGGRLFWDASKMAFRAGRAYSSQLDDVNIGEYYFDNNNAYKALLSAQADDQGQRDDVGRFHRREEDSVVVDRAEVGGAEVPVDVVELIVSPIFPVEQLHYLDPGHMLLKEGVDAGDLSMQRLFRALNKTGLRC